MLGQYQRASTDLLTPPPSAPNGLSTVSHEYLKGSYGLDLEAVRGGASNLPHLTRTLATSCRRLHRYLGHPMPCAPPLPHSCPLPLPCYTDALTFDLWLSTESLLLPPDSSSPEPLYPHGGS